MSTDLEPVGWMNYGESYLSAAELLLDKDSQRVKGLHFDGPVDFLLGHSMELMLKGVLRHSGKTDAEVKLYQHDLVKLFEAAQPVLIDRTSVDDLARGLLPFWHRYLKVERDRYDTRTGRTGKREFGVLSDAEIEAEKIDLGTQIARLNEEFSAAHNHRARYLEPGKSRRYVVQEFGLNVDVCNRSIVWFGRELHSRFVKVYRANGPVP